MCVHTVQWPRTIPRSCILIPQQGCKLSFLRSFLDAINSLWGKQLPLLVVRMAIKPRNRLRLFDYAVQHVYFTPAIGLFGIQTPRAGKTRQPVCRICSGRGIVRLTAEDCNDSAIHFGIAGALPGNIPAKRVRSNWSPGAEILMTPRISCHRGGFRRLVSFVSLVLGGILAVLGTAASPPASRSDAAWPAGWPTTRCRPRPITRRLPTSTTATTVRPWSISRPTPAGRSRPRNRAGSTRSATKRCRVSAITRWASTPRPWPITRTPWNSTRPFPHGCRRSSFSRSVPIPAGRSRPLGRFAGCKPRWANCRTKCRWGRGRSTSRRQVKQGGPVEQANLYPVEPAEILRCTALAIRRRGELLGPLAAHDPLIDNIIAALAASPRTAQPLVGGLDQPGAGVGLVGRRADGRGRSALATGHARLGRVRASVDRHRPPGTWPTGHGRQRLFLRPRPISKRPPTPRITSPT